MLTAALNEATPLRLLAADGDVTLFGRINIYNDIGTLISSLSLTHIAEGLYGTTWTPTIEGSYSAVGQFFLDALFTIEAGYEKVLEAIEVNTLKVSIDRILGLVNENTVYDQQNYNSDGCMISARIRSYESKANAITAGATGLLASYTITVAYNSQKQITNYTVVRDA